MKISKSKIKLRKGRIVIFSVFIFLVLFCIQKGRGSFEEESNTAEIGKLIKEEVELRVKDFASIVDDIVDDLNNNVIAIKIKDDNLRQTLDERLKHNIGILEDIYELGFAFEPSQGVSEQRLYARAYRMEQGKVNYIPTDLLLDYVPEREKDSEYPGNENWFLSILSEEEGVWLEPELEDITDRVLVRYGRSFKVSEYTDSEARRGVVYIVLNMSGITELLKNPYSLFKRYSNSQKNSSGISGKADLGSNGYATLETENGTFLVHYNRDSIFDPEYKNEYELNDKKGDNLYKVKISGPGWILTVKKEILPDFKLQRRKWLSFSFRGLVIVAAVLICIIFCMPVSTNRKKRREDTDTLKEAIIPSDSQSIKKEKDKISIRWNIILWIVSCLFIIATVFLLAIYYTWPNPPGLTDNIHRVDNEYRLYSFWRSHQETVYDKNEELPVAVPTGIFIQSMTFSDANTIRLTGHIWQKYTDGIHDDISRGFILPESEETTIEPLYNKRNGDTELIGWRFNVVIYQEFDYLRYPFGSEDIWVQIWHKDYYSNVVLVPDYSSYKIILPDMKPGIRKSLEIPGWDVRSTFFGYLKKNYDTSFGLSSFVGLTEFPELYFNVMVQKQILAPLVSYLLPVVFLYVLMYAILLLSSRHPEQAESYGFNAMNVVAACAGFFLVVVFCHVDLRDHIVSKEMNYLEYYYFVAYVLIVLVIINALILSLSKLKIIHYKDNLIPKILYWPVLGAVIFFISAKTFY